MKTILVLLITLPFFISCSKEENDNDPTKHSLVDITLSYTPNTVTFSAINHNKEKVHVKLFITYHSNHSGDPLKTNTIYRQFYLEPNEHKFETILLNAPSYYPINMDYTVN